MTSSNDLAATGSSILTDADLEAVSGGASKFGDDGKWTYQSGKTMLTYPGRPVLEGNTIYFYDPSGQKVSNQSRAYNGGNTTTDQALNEARR